MSRPAPAGFTWWQAGVIYQIYPRSYADTDGDGVGDLPGITGRLDHLQRLGVDAIWLSPIYPSPMLDFGYDVTDHTGIDPLFGDLARFDTLIAEAHQRGLRVLMDFIPNHTSDRHPWFTAARSGRHDPYRDWYLWADPAADGGPPNNWRSVFGGPAWTLDGESGQYFYHAYLPQQPDLNWRNRAVRAAQLDIMRTWLDRGVDGFRIDAFRHLLKDDQLRDNPPKPQWRVGMAPYDALLPEHTADHPDIGDLVALIRAVIDNHPAPRGAAAPGDRVLIGELYLPIERLMRYYGPAGAGLHLPSNMHLIDTPWQAERVGALIDAYEAALPAGAWPNWVSGNHDRSRIATRVGPAQARVAAMLLLTLRGTPTLYYGEEIGMHDVPIPSELVQDPYERRVAGVGLGRDPERTPMQWTADPGAGFCAPHSRPWLPLAEDAAVVNVATQNGQEDSMVTLYQRLLALRRAVPALSVGSYSPLQAAGDVLAYVREHQSQRIVVALNLSDRPRTVALSGISRGRILLSTDPHRPTRQLAGTVILGPDQGVIIDEAMTS
ncbi:MAG: alpha-amylase [Pseudonocardiales bacterium]|nr:MAG: alpha-amylase [Pseudonocardiales bacterium]